MAQTHLPTADERCVRITGGTPLSGTATVQGSKNIALHLYAAAILADEPLTLTGAPEILDTLVCAEILTTPAPRPRSLATGSRPPRPPPGTPSFPTSSAAGFAPLR